MKSDPVFTNQYGFTLVEIIVVLVILGVLSSMAVPSLLILKLVPNSGPLIRQFWNSTTERF